MTYAVICETACPAAPGHLYWRTILKTDDAGHALAAYTKQLAAYPEERAAIETADRKVAQQNYSITKG